MRMETAVPIMKPRSSARTRNDLFCAIDELEYEKANIASSNVANSLLYVFEITLVLSHHLKSMITVKLNTLDSYFARRQRYVPPLMGLIAIESSTRRPFAVDEFSFVVRENSHRRVASAVGVKRYN